jgi:hypothetical protein
VIATPLSSPPGTGNALKYCGGVQAIEDFWLTVVTLPGA